MLRDILVIFQKEALTLSFTLLRRRRCPYAGDGAVRCDRQSPCQGAATPTAGAAAPTGGIPLRARRGQPLAGCCPCGRPPLAGRSYIPKFQIRIEKMKEVKRPPL
ncbi:hypothetical protein GW17_00023958 [Ensete ventricosum]|nr:hypothetical protein GW17_00023958 [Ensete ventricosum]